MNISASLWMCKVVKWKYRIESGDKVNALQVGQSICFFGIDVCDEKECHSVIYANWIHTVRSGVNCIRFSVRQVIFWQLAYCVTLRSECIDAQADWELHFYWLILIHAICTTGSMNFVLGVLRIKSPQYVSLYFYSLKQIVYVHNIIYSTLLVEFSSRDSCILVELFQTGPDTLSRSSWLQAVVVGTEQKRWPERSALTRLSIWRTIWPDQVREGCLHPCHRQQTETKYESYKLYMRRNYTTN